MKLGLGTVQFGIDYGISNMGGKTTQKEVSRILEFAKTKGVFTLDTAPGYGNAEETLGEHDLTPFQIVTKTSKLGTETTPSDAAESLRKTLESSLAKLGVDSIHGLLVHDPKDLLESSSVRIWEEMVRMRERGLVKRIGVSIYDAFEIETISDRFQIDIVQVPVSVLDQRLIRSGHLRRLKETGVEIHARSAFLQGILADETVSLSGHFDSIRTSLRDYFAEIKRRGWKPVEAALGFLKSIPEIDVVLVGVNTVAQLEEIAQGWERVGEYSVLEKYGISDPSILNPARWSRRN